MSYYSPNPHYDRSDRNLDAEYAAEQAERARDEAMKYFADATKTQLQTFTDRVVYLTPYYGSPYWERERNAAKKLYADTTKDARELMERTIDCLIATGEVSEELSLEWDALTHPAPLIVRVGDHSPEVSQRSVA